MKRGMVLGIILLGIGLCATAVMADRMPSADFKTYYTTVIEKTLGDCRAKTAYRESKLTRMHQIAIRSAIKAKFLETSRDELLADMLESDLGTNQAKIDHFINRRFDQHLEVMNAHYLNFLEKKIADCKAKVGYGQSKLDSMRRKAALSALKAQFLEANREELATAMMEYGVEIQTAKLERFVNLRFSNFVHPKLMAYLTAP